MVSSAIETRPFQIRDIIPAYQSGEITFAQATTLCRKFLPYEQYHDDALAQLDRLAQTHSFALKEIMPAYNAGNISAPRATSLCKTFLSNVSDKTSHPDAFNILGIIALREENFVDAVGWLSQAIAINPDHPEYHYNIAVVLGNLGNFKDAEHHYTRSLMLQPDYAKVYLGFSSIRRFTVDDNMVKMLTTQLSQIDEKPDCDRAFLHFAAGKVYQDMKDYSRSFYHFQQGNDACKVFFDRENNERLVEQTIEVCDRALFERAFGQGDGTVSPIFIVGMPRSGTTLTGSILIRHPNVGGLGELPHIIDMARSIPNHADGLFYPHYLKTMTPEQIHHRAQKYIRHTSELAPMGHRTVDKMPANFFYLGLIALLFPNAKVIHCRRHPLDTCLSCYFKYFRNGLDFSFNLEDLGHYYRGYQQIMEHWSDVLPIPIFHLDYEQLVQNQVQVSQDLLEFCDLPWDDDCLDFHQGTHPVNTASLWQVRQPLYTSSIQRWKYYEKEIEPLRKILNC
ncbi:MAG: tetratricopeptide repeat protein [Symploca sp. SIO2B6]|nr:tetratricopeptide repeat protein [Symploca sp. SIO2B6]